MTSSASNKKIVVLTAPSGSGKSTLAARVLEALPNVHFSISVTTRSPREHEQDGIQYHFVDEARFRRYIAEGDLLEYEEVYPGCFYGTLQSEVNRAAERHPVLLDIDVKGAINVKSIFGDAVLTIFIRPPSLDVLETRLRNRGTEKEESLCERLKRAETELKAANRFDAVVVNDNLKTATSETLLLIRQFLIS